MKDCTNKNCDIGDSSINSNGNNMPLPVNNGDLSTFFELCESSTGATVSLWSHTTNEKNL